MYFYIYNYLFFPEISTFNKSENTESHNLGFVFVVVFGALIFIIIVVTVVYSFR